MYKFTNTDYKELRARLVDQITKSSVTNLNIEFENEEHSTDITFKALVAPIFDLEQLPEGNFNKLLRITPIWWECTTITLDGECINDFDLNTLNEYIAQW